MLKKKSGAVGEGEYGAVTNEGNETKEGNYAVTASRDVAGGQR